ncbi:MAG: exo-alpha-sialidase [Acidobacteria bacterium]|nr:exo-alpha-sialidase [Acidobacteriota bacterium]
MFRLAIALSLIFINAAWAGENAVTSPKRAANKRHVRTSGISLSHARQLAVRARLVSKRDRGEGEDKGDRESRTIDPDFPDGIAGGQSEFSMAVDPTGRNIVVGFNSPTRNSDPTSISGVAYSTDGGETFQDGGVLRTTSNGIDPDGIAVPRLHGDPALAWVPGGDGCNFVYASILEAGFPAAGPFTGIAFTLGIHRTRDCGKTWEGPFEVPSATNPHGLISAGSPRDDADKELLDVDPETGRVLMTWTNFTLTRFAPGGTEISASYSDDVMTGNPPKWSERVILSANISDGGGHGSMPRFGPEGSNTAYVAWSCGSFGYNVCFAASADNGTSWATSVTILPQDFDIADEILGNDRINQFPSLAVDRSTGPNRGNIYIVYLTNDENDGGDIAVIRSTDGGKTFSLPALLNNRPGRDRSQWFPSVTVDDATGRVSVIFYDQSYANTGDLTQVLHTSSDDGGITWSQPNPLTTRPFHAGYGNDTSEPNLGDYISASSQNEVLYAVWAGAPNRAGFTDGQPATSMSFPMMFFRKFSGNALPAVDLREVAAKGIGDDIALTIPLRNPVTNSLNVARLQGVNATLSTATPGVTIRNASSSYADISADAAVANDTPFTYALDSVFVPGTPIEFDLTIETTAGVVRRQFTQNTGTPQSRIIYSEDFETAAAGALPAGWSAQHGAGATTVPWVTSQNFCGATSTGLFHVNAEDGRGSNHSRWERVFSPSFDIPKDAQYVTLDFDICYDTEDDSDFPVTGYDGVTLRITDQTPGNTVRSVFAEAFAEEFQTGSILHFPKHFASSGDPSYLGAISAWSGDSRGMLHVSMKLPGMAGTTAQLRWEYTQDSNASCKAVRPMATTCGVLIDNIVVRGVTLGPTPSAPPPPSAIRVLPLPRRAF